MEIKEALTEREYFLYNKFLDRKTIKEERKSIELDLKRVMARLNECSDVKIGKELKVWKERVRQLKSNLHTKCKRLGINFNI